MEESLETDQEGVGEVHMFIPIFFGTAALETMKMTLLLLGVPVFLPHIHMALNTNIVHVCVLV